MSHHFSLYGAAPRYTIYATGKTFKRARWKRPLFTCPVCSVFFFSLFFILPLRTVNCKVPSYPPQTEQNTVRVRPTSSDSSKASQLESCFFHGNRNIGRFFRLWTSIMGQSWQDLKKNTDLIRRSLLLWPSGPFYLPDIRPLIGNPFFKPGMYTV